MGFFEYIAPANAYKAIQAFLDQGGPVLVIIMISTFLMWMLIAERYIYFNLTHRGVTKRASDAWNERTDHTSWWAHAVRERLISEVRQQTQANVQMIKTLVALAPLFGLLGTVTGMVQVFDVMALEGSSNARGMAEGVSRATIPTMAGMVSSLSGLYFSAQLEKKSRREVQKVADQLPVS
jgi:biopolymer transport protein ExbB